MHDMRHVAAAFRACSCVGLVHYAVMSAAAWLEAVPIAAGIAADRAA